MFFPPICTRLKVLTSKREIVRANLAEIAQAKKERMEAKLRKAEEKRKELLDQRIRKAHEEDEKVWMKREQKKKNDFRNGSKGICLISKLGKGVKDGRTTDEPS